MNIILAISIFLIVIFIIAIMHRKSKETFGNLNNDKFTDDSCCTDDEKSGCMKYGKTGVCNYFQNDNSCLCQNAF